MACKFLRLGDEVPLGVYRRSAPEEVFHDFWSVGEDSFRNWNCSQVRLSYDVEIRSCWRTRDEVLHCAVNMRAPARRVTVET